MQAGWCGWLQEELDFNLVVFSPYQDLMVFLKDAGMLDIAECAWCASSPPLQDCRGEQASPGRVQITAQHLCRMTACQAGGEPLPGHRTLNIACLAGKRICWMRQGGAE